MSPCLRYLAFGSHTCAHLKRVNWDAILEKQAPFKIIALLFILHLTELERISTLPVTTTTATPYVFTTAKPRRKQHQNHKHKGHDTSNRVKEILLPNNLQENEIVGAVAGDGAGIGGSAGSGSIEGTFTLYIWNDYYERF